MNYASAALGAMDSSVHATEPVYVLPVCLSQSHAASSRTSSKCCTCTLIPTQKDAPTPFIDEVDRRLYRAKLGGRNCIVKGQ